MPDDTLRDDPWSRLREGLRKEGFLCPSTERALVALEAAQKERELRKAAAPPFPAAARAAFANEAAAFDERVGISEWMRGSRLTAEGNETDTLGAESERRDARHSTKRVSLAAGFCGSPAPTEVASGATTITCRLLEILTALEGGGKGAVLRAALEFRDALRLAMPSKVDDGNPALDAAVARLAALSAPPVVGERAEPEAPDGEDKGCTQPVADPSAPTALIHLHCDEVPNLPEGIMPSVAAGFVATLSFTYHGHPISLERDDAGWWYTVGPRAKNAPADCPVPDRRGGPYAFDEALDTAVDAIWQRKLRWGSP